MKKFRLSDQVVGVSALITAVVAVVVGVAEMQVNREYARLSVEPYLDLYNSTVDDGYTFNIQNSGLGPARIQGVQVKVGDEIMSRWGEVAVSIMEEKPERLSFTESNIWTGLQIQAGVTKVAISIEDKTNARKFHENASKFTYEICYCSIYDECWTKDKDTPPVSVDECPPYLRQGF